jgi:hypothetical protein
MSKKKEYVPWGSRGDLSRKLRFDTAGLTLGDAYFTPLELSMGKALQALSLMELTPTERVLLTVALCTVAVCLLTSCAGGAVTTESGQHTVTPIHPGISPSHPTGTVYEATATRLPTLTKTAERTPTLTSTPKPPEVKLNSGGPMTPEQQAVFKSQETAFKGWWDYWSHASPRLVDPNAWAQRIAHVYADPLNPTSLGVSYEFPGQDGLYYALPWSNGAPATTAETKYDANGGVLQYTDPLRLNATGTLEDGTKYQVVWYGGRWVRADSAGKIREVIDNKGVFQKYDGVISGVYTFNDFETRQVSFSELPSIDYATLNADDLSGVKVDSSAMAKAIPVQKSEAHIRSTSAVFTFETRLDPNHSSYIDDPETRPFKVVRAFRTKVDGRDLPGAIVLVKNSDNSITKLKVLFASDFANPANAKFLNEQLEGGPATNWEPIVLSTGLSPALMPMNLNGDQMNVTIGEFHVTTTELEEIKKLMEEWQETGIAPPELGKYVIGLLPVVWVP